MQRNRAAAVGLCIAVLCASRDVSHAAAPADDRLPGLPDQTSFDTLLDRVRVAAADVKWQQAGWTDPVVERWLEDVIARVRKATGDDGYVIPVRFADVQPRVQQPQAAPPARPPAQDGPEAPAQPLPPAPPAAQQQPVAARQRGAEGKNLLIIGDDIKISHAHRSIILASGNAEISFARECVIIAGRTVNVSHGQQNVIAAGRFIHVSHDGRSMPVRGPNGPVFQPGGGLKREVVQRGSVLVSGGGVDVSHGHASACIAASLLRISHANGCAFINPPDQIHVSHETDCRRVFAEIDVDRAISPMASQVHVKWSVPQKGAVLRFNQRQYVAELGKPITDEAGVPVPGLAGWTVSYSDNGYVVFTKGREDFGVVAGEQH